MLSAESLTTTQIATKRPARKLKTHIGKLVFGVACVQNLLRHEELQISLSPLIVLQKVWHSVVQDSKLRILEVLVLIHHLIFSSLSIILSDLLAASFSEPSKNDAFSEVTETSGDSETKAEHPQCFVHCTEANPCVLERHDDAHIKLQVRLVFTNSSSADSTPNIHRV